MGKKVVLGIIAALIILMIPFEAKASTDDLPDEQLQEKMIDLLTDAQKEADLYGISGVKNRTYIIGEEIPIYEYLENGSCSRLEISLYPVICDDTEIVSLFWVDQSDDDYYVQLSTDYVSEINSYVEKDDKVCLIYDKSNLYILSNDNLTSICSFEADNSSRGKLNAKSLDNKIDMGEFGEQIELYVPLKLRATSKSCYLAVPLIKQPEDTTYCWACAMASIINYVKSTSYTALNITGYVGTTNAQTTGAVTVYLKNYGLYYSNASYTQLTSSTVLSNLKGGYPIYARFTHSGNGHAVVIRGINTAGSTFSVMNPNPTTSSYTSGTYSGTTWKFISTYSGNTMKLADYSAQWI